MAAVVLVALVSSGDPARSKRPRPQPCPGGRFLLAPGEPPLVAAPRDGQPDAIVIGDDRRLTIGPGCTTGARVRAKRTATRIAGVWPSCAEQVRVRLRGKIRQPDCATLEGTVRARKRPARQFEARRSTCGDGVLDGAVESCEPGVADCAGGDACPSDCRCPGDRPPTTTTTTTSPPPSSTAATAPSTQPVVTSTVPPTIAPTSTTVLAAPTTSTTLPALPPDPMLVATPLAPFTDFRSATAFLYGGPDPIQRGVPAGAIDALRAAVLRGTVGDAAGNPLPAVRVSVLGHPEYGHTLTRRDGVFDLVVNGGGTLTLQYERDGFIAAQRQVDVPWQNYRVVREVLLLPYDTRSTRIDFSAPVQVARGTPRSDADGSRQATLLFAQGTHAEMVLPDGTIAPLASITVRATEYTVGPRGPAAMPADLPPTSGYTYAVEFSVDEAVAAGAQEVRFDKPVALYLENFLEFPVGAAVPAGGYDRTRAAWVASRNGRVVRVLGVAAGLATLDVIGNGLPSGQPLLDQLGITDAERAQLATLYQPQQTLWRVPITHFSPWDGNYPYGPPIGAGPPRNGEPKRRPVDDRDCENGGGSTIFARSQLLEEAVAIAGTPYVAHYRSDRVPGRTAATTFDVELTGSTVPPDLQEIVLEVEVAGRTFVQKHPVEPNRRATFTWDGLDAYGRRPQGGQRVRVRVGYVYPAVYYAGREELAASFAIVTTVGAPIRDGRLETGTVTLFQEFDLTADATGSFDARAQGLGGWTFDVHHAYDWSARVLHLGSGERYSVLASDRTLEVFAGTGTQCGGGEDRVPCGEGGPARSALVTLPAAMAVTDDGSVLLAEGADIVTRVDRDGRYTRVAGRGLFGFEGDGGPATQALLNRPTGLAIGPDGSVYIADSLNLAVRRVDADGVITTVAGNPEPCSDAPFFRCGEGRPATFAGVFVDDVAAAQDGTLYLTEPEMHRVRRVGTDGVLTTLAGSGVVGFAGDGGPATAARLNLPRAVALGPDGTLYVADTRNRRVRRIGLDGFITTIAGNGDSCDAHGSACGDGGPATAAQLDEPVDVAVAPDGTLFIAESSPLLAPVAQRIRKVRPDGVIVTAAGGGDEEVGAGGVPATAAKLQRALAVAVGPDGTLYAGDSLGARIVAVAPPLPGFTDSEYLIPAEDGSEVYVFDPRGRHLRTADALTGAVIRRFEYDAGGFLARIVEGDGAATRIERDPAGDPVAVVAPFGQRTALGVDANGYLASITDPALGATRVGYGPDGLLTSFTDPRDHTATMQYDALGQLVRDDDAADGFLTLDRTEKAHGHAVTVGTALGRPSTHEVGSLPSGGTRRSTTFPGGSAAASVHDPNGIVTLTAPDGTVVRVTSGPDPRWGMASPLERERRVTTPGGLTSVVTRQRQVALASPGDPLGLLALTDTVTRNDRQYTSVYDGAARRVSDTTPMGRQRHTAYDALGRVVGEQASGLAPVAYEYDPEGHVATITMGTGVDARSQTLEYAPNGLLERVTDDLARSVRFGYDAAGRMTTQRRADGETIAYGYDAAGNTTSITPPGRLAHTFTHTPVGLLATATAPSLGTGSTTTVYGYNRTRQLTTVTRPDGQATTLGYDDAGRLRTVTRPQGTSTYDYGPSGRVTTVTAPDGGTVAYTYDGPLLSTTTWTGAVAGQVSRAYDRDFQVTMVNVAGGAAITHEYDLDGLPTRAGDLTTTYTPAGLPTGTTLASVATTQEHNDFGELTRVTATRGATTLYDTRYTRDRVGRIRERQETIGGITRTSVYGYDDAGRLVTVTVNGASSETYAYDANGNRVGGPGGATGTYDAQDRMLSYGAATYTYGGGGELATKTVGADTTTYEYDTVGNLLAVALPDGRHLEYVVDGTNRRIGKRVNGALVQGFLYQDRLRVAAELDGTGAVQSQFVYADARTTPAYMRRGGRSYRLVADHLGSVRLVVDADSGAVAQRLDYDSYGRVLADTNPGFQPFGFAGGLYDRDTGLTRFGSRDYDALTGRWTAKDPRGFAGGQTNLYAYVGDDPLNVTDPDGEVFPLITILIVAAVLGAITSSAVLAPPIFQKYLARRTSARLEIARILERIKRERREAEDFLRRGPPSPCENSGTPEVAPVPEPAPVEPAPPQEPLDLTFAAQEVEPPPAAPPPEPGLAWTESPPPCPSPAIGPPVRGLLCQ